MHRSLLVSVLASCLWSFAASSAGAATLRVPAQFSDIQAAVDAALGGDEIQVAAGSYCGAEIDRPLTLIGQHGSTIVGCDDGPRLSNGARVGFLLPGAAGSSAASGTRIAGFTFDGRGVSNQNLAPIAFGVLGRFANDVRVVGNRFLGTVQAVTNTAGDRWSILANSIDDLTLFDCTFLCTGGDAIVTQSARGSLAVPGGSALAVNRPEANVIAFNRVSGTVPDGFDVFSMAGILLLGADNTVVTRNQISFADNPLADAEGQGILVTNVCCGEEQNPILPGSRNTLIAFNDVVESETGIVIDGQGGANTQGLVLLGNRGSVELEGVLQPTPAPKPRRHHGRDRDHHRGDDHGRGPHAEGHKSRFF